VGSAFGLVHHGRIVALASWEGTDVAELGGPGGDPVVTDPGFCWCRRTGREHFHLRAPLPDGAWERARRQAAGAYFEYAER
jgi:hypothetical protein